MEQYNFTLTKPSDAAQVNSRILNYLSQDGAKPLEVTVRVGSGKRISEKQRKYYFGLIVPTVVTYYKEHPADFIRDLIEAVRLDFTEDFVHELLKIMFNSGESTTGNDTSKAEARYLAIREFYARKYNLQIPEPGESLDA